MEDNYRNPLEGTSYYSPRFQSVALDRPVRVLTRLFGGTDVYTYAREKKEILLKRKPDSKQLIKLTLFEDEKQVKGINVQKFTEGTGEPHQAGFSLHGHEIDALLQLIADVKTMSFVGPGVHIMPDGALRNVRLTNQDISYLIKDNEALFLEVLRSQITTQDVVTAGYRKQQLSIFERLLHEPDFFEERRSEGPYKPEKVWQMFFEANTWIFGYGLSYIYLDSFDDDKLEQYVQGHSVKHHGKSVDALLHSRGLLSSLCFVEIKRHDTALLQPRSHRSGCFAASSELAEAVSQIQVTTSQAMESLQGKLEQTDASGLPTGKVGYNFMPKSFLVVGSLGQFVVDEKVNADKLRSFELFRGNIFAPEIVTFDELYERARFIACADNVSSNNSNIASEGEDEMPF